MGQAMILTFGTGELVIPSSGDVWEYVAEFSVVPKDLLGTREGKEETQRGWITVELSDTQACVFWGLDKNSVLDRASAANILLDYARQHIEKRYRAGLLREREKLELHAENTPKERPAEPRGTEPFSANTFEFQVRE